MKISFPTEKPNATTSKLQKKPKSAKCPKYHHECT